MTTCWGGGWLGLNQDQRMPPALLPGEGHPSALAGGLTPPCPPMCPRCPSLPVLKLRARESVTMKVRLPADQRTNLPAAAEASVSFAVGGGPGSLASPPCPAHPG